MKSYVEHFGGKLTKAHRERYAQSPHWKGDKFENLEETKMELSFQTLPKLLYKQFCEKEGREPARLPILPFDHAAFLQPSEAAKFTWYGHSVVLLRLHGKTLLIDPMLGNNASPIAPFATNRFSDNALQLIDDFPEIDLLLLTHDHYDHLDLESIKKLKPKVKQYFVALGVARHLIKWGIPAKDITEFDWWHHQVFENIKITFTPTRHFSGRGLTDRSRSLWGGWVFATPTENIWFSGDGGYGKHFLEIGDQLGPFDFAFMECGQYNENWRQIHLFPDESVQAALDAKAQKVMPVHWAGFSLAQHHWAEPVEQFVEACQKKQLQHLTPPLGQVFSVKDNFANFNWWSAY